MGNFSEDVPQAPDDGEKFDLPDATDTQGLKELGLALDTDKEWAPARRLRYWDDPDVQEALESPEAGAECPTTPVETTPRPDDPSAGAASATPPVRESPPLDEAYVEKLHPRDRSGHWREKVGQPHSVSPGAPTPPQKLTLDQVHTGAQASQYLFETWGINGHLETPYVTRPDFYHQIATAVDETMRNYPVLRTGPVPLRTVTMRSTASEKDRSDIERAHDMSFEEAITPEAWATTGALRGDATDDPRSIVFLDDQTTEDEVGPFDGDYHEEGLSPADYDPYGRTLHELAHAVAYNAFDDGSIRSDLEYIASFEEQGLEPPILAMLSFYGASSPAEAWAEVFALLNRRGPDGDKIRAGMSPALMSKVNRLRNKANGHFSSRVL